MVSLHDFCFNVIRFNFLKYKKKTTKVFSPYSLLLVGVIVQSLNEIYSVLSIDT